jgi:hypothetical protein
MQKPDRSTLRRARDLMLERGEVPLGHLVTTLLGAPLGGAASKPGWLPVAVWPTHGGWTSTNCR